MDRLLKDPDRQAQQQALTKRDEELDAADAAKKQGQVDYMRSLGKPADRALEAFRRAGVPLSQLPPELVVAFEHRSDGTFVLKLARELKLNVGPQALLLGTTISGVLMQNEIRHLQGLRAERTAGTSLTSSRVMRLTAQGAELVLETDSPHEAQRRFQTSDVAG
jgi:aryl-alcohol dehydrogenase-like predicted oxidoreductase